MTENDLDIGDTVDPINQEGAFNDPNTPESDEQPKPEMSTFRDPKTGSLVQITEEQRIAIGHHTEAMRKKETSKMQQKLEELNATLGANEEITIMIQTELQSMKDAELTAEQRAEKKIAKEKEVHDIMVEDLRAEASNNFEMYKSNKMQNEMSAALSQHELNSVNAAMQLVMTAGNARFEKDESGNWNTLLTFKNDIGETVDMNPHDAAKAFLDQPENSYLLRASIRPGAGTPQIQRGVDGKQGSVYSREDMRNPKLKAEFSERLARNEDVSVSLH